MKSLKQAKYDLVLENIKNIMLRNGINNLTISDIAKELEIGEATIYRYFGTKLNLVIQVGISLWNDILIQLRAKPRKETGYDSVKDFFNYFIEGFNSQKKAFIFLNQFDSLMIKEKISKDSLANYDKTLYQIKQIFDKLFLQGINDSSIKDNIERDTYYYTTTHMILGICKRLASDGNILSSDDIVGDIAQIKLALDMCLKYIKRKWDYNEKSY